MAKLKRRKTTAADLPDDVIREEILPRLPIKSAVRFKSVSKSWLSLFSEPEFVTEHHTHISTQNPNDHDCFITQKHTKMFILSRYKETFLLPCDHFSLVGSIRGLVCLCNNNNNNNKFSLWNPAIHQSKEFTLPPDCSRNSVFKVGFGFGFDPVSNDYKVVVLSKDLRSADVYSSDSGSWTVTDHVFPKKSDGYYLNRSTTIVKDCPYWIFSKFTGESPMHTRHFLSLIAVRFDCRTNDFKLSPEFHSDLSGRYRGYTFVDMNDCLALIVYIRKSSNSVIDMYSLDGEEEGCCVWTKMYTIGPLDFHTRYRYVSVSEGFKYGNEILFHDQGMFSCYDHNTDTIKRLRGKTTTISFVTCFRYTPSLVFLRGMKSVHLTTQTRRTHGICSRTPRRLISSLRD